MLLKAPYILHEKGLLKDHALWIDGSLIRKIAPLKEMGTCEECLELPNTILFPGFINAHCHLELSCLPSPLAYPGSFVGWVEQLSLLKMGMTPEKTKEAIRFGVRQLLEGGTTTVADHMSINTSPQPLIESPLEGIIYLEVMGVEEKRAAYFYEEAMKKRKSENEKFKIIPTPHATYSLLPEFFSKLSIVPCSIHIAESPEETLLFKENSGPLAAFLSQKGKLPPTVGETPVQYLERLHLLTPQSLAIHANYLEEKDIAILKEFQMSVVHCPGSHAYFEYDRFPLGLLEEAEINIALGTDSLASNATLSMFEQMRLTLDQYSELTPQTVFAMATLNGAKALREEKHIGSIRDGKKANIVGIPHRFPKRSPLENILLSEKATFMMIHGQTVIGARAKQNVRFLKEEV